MVRQRVRIRFCKQQDLRFIGHRDLVRCFERLFRRAELDLSFSQGFHPKPRMTFPSALALGIAGFDEVMEVELAQLYDGEKIAARLRPLAPLGLSIKSVEVLPDGTAKARLHSVTYQVAVPLPHHHELPGRIQRLLARTSCPIQRGQRRTTVDLRKQVDTLTFEDGVLAMRLRVPTGASVSPRDVLAALELDEIEHQGAPLTRSTVEVLS